ncbi:hypothetical protein ACP70R_032331 [Stipagrostis hirtigluma subsp. patula]
MATPLLMLVLSCAFLTFATSTGIHLELTHVDAKEKCTVEELMRRAAERTHQRLASMAGGVTAPVHWAKTQYIAEYLIGDPPQKAEAIVDAGSNLVWTQCATCSPFCSGQNLPYYDPSRSRTAVVPVPCNATACALGAETRCARDGKSCAVATTYGFGEIAGFLGAETFTFQPSEKATLAFGCSAAAKLPPGSLDGASGIIGLGRGALSLVSQLGATRFSYCLTPYFSDADRPSHLFVGASAGLSAGSPVTSVPFAKLDVPAAAFGLREVAPGEWAGTLVDSGTPFTSLVGVAYGALRAELARQLGAGLVQPAEGYDLCVAAGDVGKLVPLLVLHFGGGGDDGDVVVPPASYWGPVDLATACMAVFSSAWPNARLPMNETTIIGNFMTQDMHLLYDVGKGVLSFQPVDCTSM